MVIFNHRDLVPYARPEVSSFVGKESETVGVLEYWSVGKRESSNLNLTECFHYSITPPLQLPLLRR